MSVFLPATLSQCLRVYALMRRDGLSRNAAVRRAALEFGVGESTVRSALTRNLGVDSRELDRRLQSKGPCDFPALLMRRWPQCAADIRSFVGSPAKPESVEPSVNRDCVEAIIERWGRRIDLPPELAREMRRDLRELLGGQPSAAVVAAHDDSIA